MIPTLLILFLFIVSTYSQTTEDYPEDYPKGYHMLEGIPAAQMIKEREDAYFSSRIYKGRAVDIRKYPYFGGLDIHFSNSQDTSVCGSSLISVRRLVTAAHCWNDGHRKPNEITVVLGSDFLTRGGVRINTNHVVSHPEYNTLKNDIAVIYLPYSVNYSIGIFPTALPNRKELQQSFENFPATTIGFGLTEENTTIAQRNLKGVGMRIVSDSECLHYFNELAPGVMCTSRVGKKGPCKYDSGGPLIVYSPERKILVGITIALVAGATCKDETPTAYTRIADHIHFIKSHVPILPYFKFRYEKRNGKYFESITIPEPYTNFFRTKTINEDNGMVNMESCDS